MLGAFKTAFQKKGGAVIGIGSDVPGITSEILQQAIESLRHKDIVLGRADDGGYYLIGMKTLYPELFEGIDWGTARVYEQTRKKIRHLGLALVDMPPLRDVDRPGDLAAVRGHPGFSDIFSGRSLISIIIPTLNESAAIGRLLNYLGRSEHIERIVVDGGSRDQTRDIAVREDARVLKVAGGRALQQNAGAAVARGRILLFLHADTLPPEGYADRICTALDRPSTLAGAFRFKTDDSRAIMRLVEWVTNIRSTIFQMPYGDQGIFMEKRVFDEVGGFLPLPIMEDFELMRRLSSRGRIVTLSDAAVTSARRWQRLGVMRTTLVNQIMILGFLFRMPIQGLHHFYQITGNRLTHDR
jgi:rSAM/selenodomain-associated transferase 2